MGRVFWMLVFWQPSLRERRVIAAGIDVLLAWMAGVAATRALNLNPLNIANLYVYYLQDDLAQRESAMFFFILAAWVIYRSLAEASGQGLGKWMLDVELQAADGRPGLARSAMRAFTAPHDAIAAALGMRRRFDELYGLRFARAERIRSERGWRIGRQVPWIVIGLASAWLCWRTPDEVLLRRYWEADAEYACCNRDIPQCRGPVAGLLEVHRRGNVAAERYLNACERLRKLRAEEDR